MDILEKCLNCQKQISSIKIATHLAYCRRNVIKCPKCSNMYDKNFEEDHELQFHAKKCQHCSKNYQNLVEHISICEYKPVFCSYCELNVPKKTWSKHEKQCQSRTVQCPKCTKYILNKDFIDHQKKCNGKTNKLHEKSSTLKNQQLKDSLSQLWESQFQTYDYENSFEYPYNPQIKKFNRSEKQNQKQIRIESRLKPRDNKVIQKQAAVFSKNKKPYERQYQDFNESNFYTSSFSSYQEDDLEQQLFQQIILQSTKNKTKVSQKIIEKLPSDFYSEQIMNKSFYKDILDIEKQNAILEDIAIKQKNSRKR